MSNEENQFKVVAQAKKVMAMVAVIDRAALARKPPIDPYGNAGQVLLSLSGYNESSWAIVDRVSKVKTKSSPETRDKVKQVYRDRANRDPMELQ